MGATLKRYIWIIGIVCVVIISYLLAKITTIYIEGYFPNMVITAAETSTSHMTQKTSRASKIDIQSIIKRNIFDALETPETTPIIEDDTEEVQQVTSDKAIETKLGIKLISTISVGDGTNKFSSCVIESNRKNDTYVVGGKKTFHANTKIVRILPRRVEFMNNNQLEFVKLEEFANSVNLTSKPTIKSSDMIKRVTRDDENPDENIVREGNSFQIAKTEVDAALANISKLYTDIRGVPYFEDGTARGFKILSVKGGSLFDKLGIKRGDILKSVNGKTLDIQSGLETFKALKSETEFMLEINRRGEDLTYNYEII